MLTRIGRMFTPRIISAAVVILLTSATSVLAQAFPAKPIKMIVPYPPGGGNDTVARLIGQVISNSVGQAVIIENRPGASTLVGAAAVAGAEPNGYTLLFTSGLALNELLHPAKSNKTTDFAPIALVASLPYLVAVHPSLPNTLDALIAYAKSNPGKINYPTFGKGTSPHLACEMFAQAADVKMTDVPYRGGAPAVQDVVRGEMQLACDTLLMMEFVRVGKLHAIGVMSKTRAESAPDVPTFIELGLPGVVASISFALYAPAGTPPAIIDILNREANKALNEPSVIRGIRLLGGTPEGGTAERLAAILQEDRVRWQKLISSLNLDLSE